MNLSPQSLDRFMMLMMTIMQASILVPMAVVWWRRRHFPAPIRLLSWYVYLSLFSALASRLLYPKFVPNNYWSNIGFNAGKIILLAGVYYQVLVRPSIRKLVVRFTVATVAGLLVVTYMNMLVALSIARVAQCALLAGFALFYLDQFTNRTTKAQGSGSQDPMWLLSVAQLLYGAITVTAFSFDYLSITELDQTSKYIFVAIGGIVFNGFLTILFLRARHAAEVPASETALRSDPQMVF